MLFRKPTYRRGLNYTAQNPQWELGIFNGKDCFVLNDNVPDLGHFNIYNPIDSYWNLLSLNDFNGDGKTDIIKLKKNEFGHTADYTIYYSNSNTFSSTNSGEIVFYGGFSTYGLANQFSYEHVFPFTDFNGDGNLDIYVDNGVWGDYIYFHEVDNETKRMISIKNGFASKTSIVYLPLTSPQVYKKDLNPQFPVTTIQPPFYVVRSVKSDIGDAHLTTQTFFYENLLLHKQGKGLLSFGKRSVTNHLTGITAETTNELYLIQKRFYLPYAKEIKAKKATGEIISLTTNTLKHKSYASSPLRLFPYIESTHTFERDITTNGFVKTTHTDFTYDDYGNILTKVLMIDTDEKQASAVASEYDHQTTFNYLYYPPDLTNWHISKLEKTTTQYRLQNEVKDGATQILHYYPSGHSSFPLLKEKKYFPSNILNGNLATSELITYDDFGNVETITLSAPNSQPQLETRTSSSTYEAVYHHRFPATTTNALGNTSTSTYDPVYGTLKTSTGPNGLTSYYESNPLGTFSKTTSPDGSTTITVSRWAHGNEHAPVNAMYYTWQQTSGSPEALVFYHKTGAELRSVTFGFDGQPVYIDKIYNNKGLLHKESLPYKNGTIPIYTEYVYDAYNRLKDVITPDNTITTTSYAANEVSVTVVNGNITRTSKKKYNAAGWLVESTDNSGNIVKNEYYCNGNLKKSYISGQPATAIKIKYDDMGNRTLLDDPNYGQIESVYNAYGELVTQTNSRGQTISFSYDKLGRKISETGSAEGDIVWNYSVVQGRIGTLESIVKNNHITNYTYDNLLRLITETETINNVQYATNYTYDELSRPFRTTYPTGVTLQDGYNNYGYHTTVSLENSGKQLWKTEQVNAMGLVTKYRTGNNLETEQSYYPLTSLPYTVKTVKSGNNPIQDLEYKWFGLGNLEYRKKWLNRSNNTSLTESFTYDGLDRLTSVSLNSNILGNYVYDVSKLGNITYNQSDGQTHFSDAIYGAYGYGPHAIAQLTTTNPILTGPRQDIVYNSYDKVSAITEGNHSLQIRYGHHRQRISQQYTDGDNVVEKVWTSACEYITKNGQQYKHTYLSGPLGLFAIHIIYPDGTEEINYIHTDHLGSWNTLTDEAGNLLQELSFDAWGNRRDPATWRSFAGTAPEPLFDRGFTGHEHLYAFNLINMNGRMYDPLIGRMLSPDNYIQTPDFSQSFNRYSYCFNNPLKYTDPSGEIFMAPFFLMAMLADYTSNLINGHHDPLGTAYKNVSSTINGINNAVQVPVFQSQNTNISIGLNPFSFGVSMNASFRSSNVTQSFQGDFGFFGANFGATTTIGGFYNLSYCYSINYMYICV